MVICLVKCIVSMGVPRILSISISIFLDATMIFLGALLRVAHIRFRVPHWTHRKSDPT